MSDVRNVVVNDLLTTAEAAEVLRVSVATLSKYAREGTVAAITLPGGQRRFRRADVLDLLTPAEPKAAG